MSYNSKYTGQQVEALLDIVSQGGGTGGEGGEVQKTTETEILAMGFTKNEGTITEVKMNGVSKGTSGVIDLGTVITEHQDISGKQDIITDLELIREGASLGATALQEVPSGYAKTEDIPTKVSQLENNVPYALKSDVEFEGNVENGVYIMTASGSIVAPTTTDNTALGVVLITDNQRILISKADAASSSLKWGVNLWDNDIATLENKGNESAAKADFSGKNNTSAIIKAYSEYNVDINSDDMCAVLSTYTDGGFNDWYVPALGQLYEIYINKTDINTALANIDGTAFKAYHYWSSSENRSGYAWKILFSDGSISDYDKRNGCQVRFVRDISATISLKDKVSELESDKVDKESLSDIAISGSYNDLKDKPAIPTKVSELENDANYIAEDVVENGVYAVDANGKLIDYTTADNTAIGVAIVAGENQFMVSTKNIHYGSYSFWGKGISDKDIANVTNYDTFNGTLTSGKITSSDDFTTWIEGALSDFNGKSNTTAIIDTYSEDNVSMDYYDMCKALNTFNEKDMFNDWYIPSLGQLALIYVNITEINSALTSIGKNIISEYSYWSSSEKNSNRGWLLQMTNGKIESNSKSSVGCYLRAIRDISAVSSLKDKVSNLENSKQDLLISGTNIKTINGQSILGEGDITIEGGGGSSSGGNGAYSEVNHGTSDTTFTLTPNTFHVWDEVAALDLSLGDETAGVANEFLFQFTSGITATTLTLPDGLRWANDVALAIAENRVYQVSVLKGFASVLEFEYNYLKFYIGEEQYYFEANMTWNDWVNSKCNTGNYTIYGSKVVDSSMTHELSDVNKTDLIVANVKYTLGTGGAGPT